MTLSFSRLALGASLAAASAGLPGVAAAQHPGAVTVAPSSVPSMTVKEISSRIGLDRKDGERIAVDATLTDDDGRTVRLGDLIEERPTLLMPMFYRCQTACALEVDNLLKVLVKEEAQNAIRRMAAAEDPGLAAEFARKRHLLVGRDLNVVFLSIHPKETVELARTRRALVTEAFDIGWQKLPEQERAAKIATAQTGFHYLTGTPEEVRKVTDSIGFRWFYYAPKDQMNHVAASVMLTPTGKIATYFTGVEYATRVISNAVEMAEREEVAPNRDTFLLGCIMVDPVTGARTIVFNRVVMLACFLTLGALGVSIFVMARRYPDRVKVSDLIGRDDLDLSNPHPKDGRPKDVAPGGDGAA